MPVNKTCCALYVIPLVPVVFYMAPGGVSNIGDIEELKNIGCEGVIIGKALYENRISLKELERFI